VAGPGNGVSNLSSMIVASREISGECRRNYMSPRFESGLFH